LPGIPAGAASATASFASLPAHDCTYSFPYECYDKYGIRGCGFHGISHAYCALRDAERLGSQQLRMVTCHLGSWCSLSAIRNGAPLATTMGFTPLDGVVMGTRPGSIDPGIIPYLERRHQLTPTQIEDALNHQSGLLGISGLSADFREIERAANGGNTRARLALDIFTYSIRGAIGALAVNLGGIDALIFAGGIGEHAAAFRGEVCRGLELIGIQLDPQANLQNVRDGAISIPASKAKVLVIETRESIRAALEEALRAQRVSDPAQVAAQEESFARLAPGPDELAATLYIDIADPAAIADRLTEIVGFAYTVALEVGELRVQARPAEPDMVGGY